jgi:hypothetical protein
VVGDLPTARLHRRLAECRVYLHPIRWTSLGLSLIEAMQAGMPVVALATTEAYRAVPPGAGAVSTDLDVLVRTARELVADPDAARAAGEVARAHALERYGLGRFLAEWDAVLEAVLADGPRAAAGAAVAAAAAAAAAAQFRNSTPRVPESVPSAGPRLLNPQDPGPMFLNEERTNA